ncbi:hypothetical protein HPB50_007493 [Hyalomma asiaticum]|uniref:Uncharacterized protein n=1 Tax=Hyalomma asiaticum TaxID=266040 RepID=A0ACB7S1C2_HYAAI|nr:hypothetical protein HPB50_007493 [Hyalomma asiaticum]
MVGDLWKLVHVPELTFANRVVNVLTATRGWLEWRQREVGRIARSCHGGERGGPGGHRLDELRSA